MIILTPQQANAHYTRLQGRGSQTGDTPNHSGYHKGNPRVAIRNLRIKADHKKGWSKGKLADHYNLGLGTITQIIRSTR